MKTLSILIIIATVASAHARISETEQQIESHLGKPFRVLEDGRKVYTFGAFNISITYENGVSQQEMYVKSDHSDILQKEIDKLLRLNSGSLNWKYIEPSEPRVSPTWRTTDDRRMAFYNSQKRFLLVVNLGYVDRHAKPLPKPRNLAKSATVA